LNQRATDVRPVCNYFSRSGHIARNCFRNPQSQLFRGGQQSVPYRQSNGGSPRNGVPVNYLENVSFPEESGPQQSSAILPSEFQQHPSHLTEQDQRHWRVNHLSFQKEALIPNIPLCMLNSSKLVTETVQCGNMVVKAVVGTGAVITVISPKLLTCTEFKLDSWYGPNIVMANGTTVSPIGAAYITVTVHNKLVTGTAVVMHMEGMDLLLGNDFLKQFGKLHIDYQASKTLLTVGDFPFNLLEPQKMELTEANKFPTTEGVNIPSFFIQHVPILSPSEETIQLFIPFQSLETIVEDADRNSAIPDATPDTLPTIARLGTSYHSITIITET